MNRACRFPGITPRRSFGMAGQSGVNIPVHPANFSKPLYDTVPHKDSVPLEKYWNNQAIMLPFGLCTFGGKPARTFRVRAGLFRGVGAFVRKKSKVSATVLAFCIVNIHLCPGQNKKKMDDKTLKNSYLYATYKPHVYPTWPTRFLYREFSLPSHLKHPAQNPAVSENRMQF